MMEKNYTDVETMREQQVDDTLTIVFMVAWLAGVVLAKGFWLTAAAAFFPPYAWYLVIECALVAIGWVGAGLSC